MTDLLKHGFITPESPVKDQLNHMREHASLPFLRGMLIDWTGRPGKVAALQVKLITQVIEEKEAEL